MRIEVAYALPQEQYLYEQQVDEGTTLEEALKASQLLQEFPELDVDQVGIFGRVVPKQTVLQEGDRIEVYRPLKADPRDRRRQQVEDERRKQKSE
jgi:hypothetical protein